MLKKDLEKAYKEMAQDEASESEAIVWAEAMMSQERLSIDELNRRAIAVLIHELGVAETFRFLRQVNVGKGNYTEERRTLFANVTMDDICRDAERLHEREEKSDK